jgi:hypothetical protein
MIKCKACRRGLAVHLNGLCGRCNVSLVTGKVTDDNEVGPNEQAIRQEILERLRKLPRFTMYTFKDGDKEVPGVVLMADIERELEGK